MNRFLMIRKKYMAEKQICRSFFDGTFIYWNEKIVSSSFLNNEQLNEQKNSLFRNILEWRDILGTFYTLRKKKNEVFDAFL